MRKSAFIQLYSRKVFISRLYTLHNCTLKGTILVFTGSDLFPLKYKVISNSNKYRFVPFNQPKDTFSILHHCTNEQYIFKLHIFYLKVVEQILNLFDHYDDAAGWDTGALDKFLHNESRQLIELKNLVICNVIFICLFCMFHLQNYNGESWEKIRRAVLLHLTRMAVMTGHV
uniref:Uncharacterized protein n=1 Tax=Astyanax mexicanus TaxID=7994 RepID=A0A8B9GKZ7_ASTMX